MREARKEEEEDRRKGGELLPGIPVSVLQFPSLAEVSPLCQLSLLSS